MNNTTTTKFSLLHRMKDGWVRYRDIRHQNAVRRACPTAEAAARRIPPEVRVAWTRRAPQEFPGLRVDDGAWLLCSVGLAQFFEVCQLQQAQGPVALPSKGADSIWHAWLACDPAGLAAWQRQHFGREWPHRETASLGAPSEDSLARSWAGACRHQRLNPLGPILPLMFALDGRLRVPTGWAYRYRDGTLVHRQIDGFGQPSGNLVTHAAMGAGALLALGLLTEAELRTHRRANEGGSGCGSSSSDGCDGGSSCGSSCGSGCGGGGD